ncbi:hypothetical protein Tco_0065729 [Tanacetum coccineum]
MASSSLPWTTMEEITLCTAWCNAKDTYGTREIHGRKGFWEDVFANFEKDMGGTIRRYDAIPNIKRAMDKKQTQSNLSTPEKPPMSLIFSIPTIEEKADEHEIGPYLNEEEYQQLLVDETTFKEHLEEEAKAEKERAIADKELEEFMKAEQAHDELFRMEFGVKSDSEYETD